MRIWWRRLMNRWFPYQDLYDVRWDQDATVQEMAGVELHRPPTLDEITPPRPFIQSPPSIPFPEFASVSMGALRRSAIEFARHREEAISYGRLIGCTDEEIQRTIGTHLKLSMSTAYQLNWNRVRDDLLAIKMPSASLHRYWAAGDDERTAADGDH